MVETTRLHYYQRQVLGALDFELQQTYHRDMRRRHQLGHHAWGIIGGLELVEVPAPAGGNEVDVFVSAGMAIDGFGREIIVPFPAQLDLSLFAGFTAVGWYEVWLAYDEELTGRPAYGYEQCNVNTEFGRVRETYRILAGAQPKPQDPMIVDGKEAAPLDPAATPTPEDLLEAIPADESVPYQEFPDDDDVVARWLIRLGSVHCDPINGQLLKIDRTQPDAVAKWVEGRRYVGVVAQDVLAPAATLRLRPRAAFSDADAADFAQVEGRLQVAGRIVAKKDVKLHGGKLWFQGVGGDAEPNAPPLWMQRIVGASGTGVDLRIHIGDTAAATTRLTVGPTDGGSEKPVLTVRGDDKVEIPTGTLDYAGAMRQMLNLRLGAGGTFDYGLGVQSATTYFRSEAEFCWFKGGQHNDAQSNAGGGALQLRLDDQARLHFGAQVRQMLNLWNTNYGIGVQSWTLYYRSDADFCWFRGGSHSNNRSEPGGGVLAMKLDNANNLAVTGSLTASGVTSTANANITGNTTIGGNATIAGDANIGGDATISGDLHVTGTNNLMRVFTTTLAMRNFGANTPSEQVVSYAGENFVHVYAAFAVLQGFSLWDYGGNPAFTPNAGHHAASDNAIPQHVFVQLLNQTLTQATVRAYCSESFAGQEADNTVLVTVVVMGRTA